MECQCPETPQKRNARMKNEIRINLGNKFLPPLSCFSDVLAGSPACYRIEKGGTTENSWGGCWEECWGNSGCWTECWHGCCSSFLSKENPPLAAPLPALRPAPRISPAPSPAIFWGTTFLYSVAGRPVPKPCSHKNAVAQLFWQFLLFFQVLFGCFPGTLLGAHSAPFSALFRLFSRSGVRRLSLGGWRDHNHEANGPSHKRNGPPPVREADGPFDCR